MKTRTTLLLAGHIACVWCTGAFAQDIDTQEPSYSGGISEIVVTATKRAENLQDVPVAISAITSDQLKSQGVFSTSDLNGAIPNLQVSSAYGETQPNFTLRGIGVGTEYNSNAASPIGVYVDEVYQSFRPSHGQQLYDLEQVEVVRGPQGTLYGRNTTGGAINFITRKPSLDGQNGYLTLGYGRFNRVSAEGAIELTPVEDKLGIRISGTYVKSDSYIKNVLPAGTIVKSNPSIADADAFGFKASGVQPGGAENFGLRGTIRFQPSDVLDLNFKAYVAQTEGGQDAVQSTGNRFPDDTINLANSAIGALYTLPAFDGLLPPGFSNSAEGLGPRETSQDTLGSSVVKTFGVVFNAKVELGGELDLISITGFDRTHFSLLPEIDCDGTPFSVCAIGYESRSRSFNQDLRLDYHGDQFKMILGAYYGYDKIKTRNRPNFYGFLSDVNLNLGLPLNYFNPGGLVDPTAAISRLKATQNFDQVRKSYAIYGEASYQLADTVKLTAGLRYTKDKFSYQNALTTFFDDTGVARMFTVSDYQAGGEFQNFVFDDHPGEPLPGAFSRSDSASRVTGRVILDWKPVDDVLTYVSYSRGYRGGTYNGLAFQFAKQVYFVEPEVVDAFEIGFKSRFMDNRVQFNVALFHYKYKNQQNQLIDPSAVTFLINLDGTLTGLEADLIVQPVDSLNLSASIGYLDSEYDDGNCTAAPIGGTPPQLGNCLSTAGGNVDIGGNPFPYAAKFTANFGVDWTALETDNGRLILHGDASYTGRYYYDTFGSYDYSEPGVGDSTVLGQGPVQFGGGKYWMLNTRATYEMEHLSLSVYVKNLTDKLYYPNYINVEGSYGSNYRVRAAPRTFGVQATYSF